MAEDQAVRTGIAPPGDDRTADELFGQMGAVDRENTARMEEILEELQEQALAYLMGAVEADDASAGDLAYLIDRVRVANGLPQVYGTQIGPGPDGDLAPRTPVEDPVNVDARRAEAGLGTLEEYYDEIREAFGTPAPSTSS